MSDPATPNLPAAPPNSGLAVTSLVLGICGFVTCGLTGIPAVITGHMALSQIKKSGQTIGGGGFALAGTILGYVSFLLIGVAGIAGLTAPMVIRQRQKADQVQVISNMRQLGLGLMEYNMEHGTETAPYPADLNQLKTLSITTNLEELLAIPKRHQGDWLYFPSANLDDPYSPLLISPSIGSATSSSSRQMILSTDGSVVSKKPADVRALVGSLPTPPITIPAPVK